MARKMTAYDISRISLRDQYWPDAPDAVWNRKAETGFTTIPRTLPLICTLLRYLGKENDPSRVYLTLWGRSRDYGFVEILDPEELASECGYYRGTRKVRSLHEALTQLRDLGFIRVMAKGTRVFGFILLLHPNDVVQRMRYAGTPVVPDWWWSLFTLRVHEIKTKLRVPPPKGRTGLLDEVPEALDAEDDDLPF